MNLIKKVLKIGSMAVVTLLLALCGLCVYADNAEYTTAGGSWIPVGDNLWAIDKNNDGQADTESTGQYSITLTKNGNTWVYRFAVPDPNANYYAWEELPEDSDYEISGGYGSRENPAITQKVAFSHTENLDDAGTGPNGYGDNKNITQVVTIPGASQLNVTITYQTESTNWDWVCMWEGNYPNYTAASNYSTSKTGKLGGKTKTTKTYAVQGDTVTFGFKSDSSVDNYYGYYAVVTGLDADGNPLPASITNKLPDVPQPEYGSLTLSKTVTVTGTDTVDAAKNFQFTITLKDKTQEQTLAKYLTGVQTFGDVTFMDGVAAVTLKHGETVTMGNIPAGLTYTITETPADGYTLKAWADGDSTPLTPDDDGAVTGTIVKDTAVTVACTNTKTPPPPKEETGSFSVQKTVVNGETGAEFTFRAALFGLAPNTAYAYTVADDTQTFKSNASGMADVQFTLQGGQTAKFNGLPVGCQYQVLESAAEGYTAAYTIEGTGVQAVRGQQSNTEPGEELSTAKETLDEDEDATVHFTNTKPAPNPDVVSIPVAKVWADNDNLNNTRPESITVYLLQSTSSTEPGDVVATALLDETNNWTYTFTDLDKFQPDGVSEYVYTVQEVQVPGYTTAITGNAANGGYTITNTAVNVGKLKISKTVAGQTDDTTEFRFTLTLKDAENNPITGAYPLDDTDEHAKTGTLYFDEHGAANFTLKDGETLTLTALPAGATYTLTEASYNGYRLETAAENLTGTIKTGETQEVAAVNRRLHDLTVSKRVEGSMGDKTKDFAFTLALRVPDGTTDTGLAVPDSVAYTKGGESGTMEVTNGKVTFTLAHGESITFKGLPAGLGYTVEEDGTIPVLNVNDGYDVTIPDTSNGTLNSDVTAAFINTRNGTVPTGLVMTVFPFALIALLGGTGLIWYAVRKKRRGQAQ